MASKKSKSDLLVRTRYQNPIPAPTFPPQTIDIPTELSRLGHAELTSSYASSLPLPMMVDAEIGMPLDLNACTGLWWDGVSQDFNPAAPVSMEVLHPDDAELLEAPSMSAQPGSHVHAQASSAARPRIKPEETWLRGTTYMAKNDARGSQTATRIEQEEIEVPDASMLAQLQLIERTFWQHDQINQDNIKNIRHPTKKGVTAIDAFDLLPDEDGWGTLYNQVLFPERPSNKQGQKSTNEQLLTTIFRPRETPLRGFQAYVPLPEELPAWKRVKQELLPTDEDRDLTDVTWPVARYPYDRAYEISGQHQHKQGSKDGNVVVLTFCDGEGLKQQDETVGIEVKETNGNTKDEEDEDEDDIFGEKDEDEEEQSEAKLVQDREMQERLSAKGRGVFYVNVFSNVNLKRLRTTAPRNFGELDDNWDSLTLAFQGLTQAQQDRRQDFLKALQPDWLEAELRGDQGEDDMAGEGMEEDDGVL